MDNTEAYVKLDKVSKIYKMGEIEIRAVDEISFEISKGEFVVIVGPSGAGKTTVLNILGGMDTASKGKVSGRLEGISQIIVADSLRHIAVMTSVLYSSFIIWFRT